MTIHAPFGSRAEKDAKEYGLRFKPTDSLTLRNKPMKEQPLENEMSGYLTPKVYWSMKNRGLTISGSGRIPSGGYEIWYPDPFAPDELYGEQIEEKGELKPWQSGEIPNGFEQLVIENGITEIGNYSFSKTYIEQVDIAGSVYRIGEEAFYDAGIHCAVLHEGIKKIDSNAFHSSGCCEIYLPSSIEYIGRDAFGPDIWNDTIFRAPENSYAEQYANKCGFVFVPTDRMFYTTFLKREPYKNIWYHIYTYRASVTDGGSGEWERLLILYISTSQKWELWVESGCLAEVRVEPSVENWSRTQTYEIPNKLIKNLNWERFVGWVRETVTLDEGYLLVGTNLSKDEVKEHILERLILARTAVDMWIKDVKAKRQKQPVLSRMFHGAFRFLSGRTFP